MKLNTKVVTGKVKLNYVNIKEAKAINLSTKPKYGTTILIPKESNTMALLTALASDITIGTIEDVCTPGNADP